MSQYYSKGTIKVKNADGQLVPFLPKTTTANITDDSGNNLNTKLQNIYSNIEEAENSGGIEIMYEEPDENNTADFSNETMIGWVEPDEDEWIVRVDTQNTKANNKTAIPFNLYNQSEITLTVDWGDGNNSTLTSSDYTASSASASIHEYANPGVYEIRIKCNNWNNVYFLYYSEAYVYSKVYDSSKKKYIGSSEPSYNIRKPMFYWQYTLEKILTPIPPIKGCMNINRYTGTPTYNYYTNSISSSTYYNVTSSCVNLSTICTNGLKNIQNASYLFNNCACLKTSIKSLFDNLTENITTFYGCFYSSSITSIPAGLFDKFINATSFAGCFGECSSLTSIPADLFKYNTLATNFRFCFTQCSSLTSIPADLFKYNTAVTDFYACFQGCTSLTSIPSGLFDNCTSVTSFEWCFNGCSSLTSIPSGLFDDCNSVIKFDCCFQGCTSLTSIPSGLFDNCTSVTSFGSWDNGCFRNCSSLLTIPSGLFDNCTSVTSFNSCFQGCSSLTSIPADLFKYNNAVTDFDRCFQYCSSLTSIPQDLFRYNTRVTKFQFCFGECLSLTSIPQDLFKYNTLVEYFYRCFYKTSLTTIPTDLFKYNTVVNSFGGCFEDCTTLNDFTIHIGSPSLDSTPQKFCPNKSGTTRIIYVPSGSSTQTRFNSVASTLGLTIIGE